MAEQDAIYKCTICGNVVEVIEAHDGALICCGKEMEKQEGKFTENEGNEKHVPILTVEGNKVTIKVGNIDHPMTEEHYIELIEVLGDGKVIASYHPSPGEEPKAEFELSQTEGLTARIYCNVHLLWRSE